MTIGDQGARGLADRSCHMWAGRKYGTPTQLGCKNSPEQEAVSVGSPSQASADAALMQWRDLVFLPLIQEGSHSDHSPHSAQELAAPTERKETEQIYNGFDY